MKTKTYRIKDICDVINGRAYLQPELQLSGKYKILRVGNFFSSDRWYYSDMELPDDKYCNDGDLLFAWSASFGPKIWRGEKTIYHYHIWKMVPHQQVDKIFLYYWLLLSVKDLTAGSHGSVMAHMTKSDMENFSISLPERKEQERIARILSSLDDKIELNNQINRNLEEQAKAIFKSWFVDFEPFGGNVPKGLKEVQLQDICELVTKGTTPTTLGYSFTSQGINFIKAESITDWHELDTSKFSHIDAQTNDALKRSIIHAGDILFSIAGTLGRFAVVNDSILPANTNQAVAIIRPNPSLASSNYIYSFFLGGWHEEHYKKRIQQAVQANLSLTTIKSLPILLLPDYWKKQYEEIVHPIFEKIDVNSIENRILGILRDTLLPKLMSGEMST